MGFFDGLLKNLGSVLTGVSLENAAKAAPAETGVYKLYLDGKLMKVGKAQWEKGIRWRMQQYWRGDSTAGVHGSAIHQYRHKVRVSWIVCPPESCRDLELEQQNQAGGISNLPWCERC